MRLIPESSSLARWLALPVAVLAAAGLAALRWFPETVLGLAHCPLRDLTGLACPTCGGTHAALALARGQWASAWAANPLVPLGCLLLALWGLWALLAAGLPALRVRPVFSAAEKRAARILAALAIIGLWLRQALVLG